MTIDARFLGSIKYNVNEHTFINNENVAPPCLDQLLISLKTGTSLLPKENKLVNKPVNEENPFTVLLPSPFRRSLTPNNDSLTIEDRLSSDSALSSNCSTPIKSLSQSAGTNQLSSFVKDLKSNLSQSCFADLRSSRSEDIDSELRCLSWLQEGDLVNGFTPGVIKSPETNSDEELVKLPDVPSIVNDMEKTFRKPAYSFSTLIFMAIENAKDKKLPVKEIYKWIQDTFPYYQKAPDGWKNSVRHNLSLNKSFKKVDKEKCIGKGSLWTIDHQARASLVHQLRKTATYHSYPYAKSSYPQNYTKFLCSKDKSCKRDSSGRFVSDRDDAEFDAAAIMCSLSAPANFHCIDQRSRRHINKKGSADLLRLWRTYIEPNSSEEKNIIKREMLFEENTKKFSINNFLDEIHRRTYGKGKPGRKPKKDSSEESYEEEESEDEEMSENMRRLVDDEIMDCMENSSSVCDGIDHSYSKTYMPESTGVAALLDLANVASMQREKNMRAIAIQTPD